MGQMIIIEPTLFSKWIIPFSPFYWLNTNLDVFQTSFQKVNFANPYSKFFFSPSSFILFAYDLIFFIYVKQREAYLRTSIFSSILWLKAPLVKFKKRKKTKLLWFNSWNIIPSPIFLVVEPG